MPIHLLAGPPCSGKSTLAQELAREGDLILDFDAICIELTGRPGWAHPKRIRERAGQLLERRIAQLPHHHHGTAYLIRCAPDPQRRAHLARHLGAQVWMLNPGRVECLRRAQLDRRPRSTIAGIHDWYTRYRPSPLDRPASELR